MVIDDLLLIKNIIKNKPSHLRTREEERIVILLEELESELKIKKKLEESRKFDSLTKITSGPGGKCPCCGS